LNHSKFDAAKTGGTATALLVDPTTHVSKEQTLGVRGQCTGMGKIKREACGDLKTA